MKPHHKLKVWKRSRNFVKHVYQLTAKLPDEEKFGLTAQMRRAAISIPSNIAEGAGRNNHKEFNNYLRISQGSIAELETQILIGQDLGHFKDNMARPLLEELDEISRMVIGLQKSLRKP
jgi:four helix bundle protein